ncbi:MAG: M24 family metallopeptidase C-terminal domain-containing protein, partial [Sphingorhabdus sp.]
YYKAGAFGIRIENLVLVRAAAIDGAEGDFLELENLTWAPLEPRLIDTDLLAPSEIAWVNDYHVQVRKIIGVQLDGDDKAWLESVCQPL